MCPGIPQILGMGMALAAVSENGDGLAFEHRKVGILIIIGFHEILRMINHGTRREAPIMPWQENMDLNPFPPLKQPKRLI